MSRSLYLFLIFLISSELTAQSWTKAVVEGNSNDLNAMLVNSNGHAHLLGWFSGNNCNNPQQFLGVLKYDTTGSLLNCITLIELDKNDFSRFKDFTQDANGDFYFIGESNKDTLIFGDSSYVAGPYSHMQTAIILKTDKNGNPRWAIRLEPTELCFSDAYSSGQQIEFANEHVYLQFNVRSDTDINGYVFKTGCQVKNILVKMDTLGNVKWARNTGYFFKIDSQGNSYIALGRQLTKLNDSEIILWQKSFQTGILSMAITDKDELFLSTEDSLIQVNINTGGNANGIKTRAGLSNMRIGLSNKLMLTRITNDQGHQTTSPMQWSEHYIYTRDLTYLGHFNWARTGESGNYFDVPFTYETGENQYFIGTWLYSEHTTQLYFGDKKFYHSSSKIYLSHLNAKGLTWPAGIGDENQIEEFLVWPNPASDYLSIQLNPNSIAISAIVLDLSGKQIKQVTTKDSEFRISLDGIEPGLYFLQLETVNGQAVKKFIVE